MERATFVFLAVLSCSANAGLFDDAADEFQEAHRDSICCSRDVERQCLEKYPNALEFWSRSDFPTTAERDAAFQKQKDFHACSSSGREASCEDEKLVNELKKQECLKEEDGSTCVAASNAGLAQADIECPKPDL